MSVVIDITQQAAMTALRTFLVAVAPDGVEVVLAQGNRVPMPGGMFIAMTPLMRTRLETNVVSYVDPVTAIGSRLDLMPTRFTRQIDCYAAGSGDVAQMIAALFRSEYATASMDGSGATPLYAGEPRQMPIVNGESQYEERWT